MSYEWYDTHGVGIKAWTKDVPFEAAARSQVRNVAELPFVGPHVAVMPDVHFGIGATVGSVIPTRGAIIPAAVGVDIGCGMIALQTSLTAEKLPDELLTLRRQIERDVPVGQNEHREPVLGAFDENMEAGLYRLVEKHPKLIRDVTGGKAARQVGTLGGGNHFIELCLDESGLVWVMLHSGSRGVGNQIGRYFIDVAKDEMRTHFINLPDRDLAYLPEGTTHFDDYIDALTWAQDYAARNRLTMLQLTIAAMRRHLPNFTLLQKAVNCHHNYVSRENHFGQNLWITRKGAVSARDGELGIIPGSMGARSFIVRGLGNPDSFHSCSHGAGRVMSRGAAKQSITLAQHIEATAGVECRKDEGVIDESPAAYKSIDSVMAAQADLVEIVHTLKQVLCVKG